MFRQKLFTKRKKYILSRNKHKKKKNNSKDKLIKGKHSNQKVYTSHFWLGPIPRITKEKYKEKMNKPHDIV